MEAAWRAERLYREAGRTLAVYLTRGPGDARERASSAAAEFDAVVALGGDGTVHEVVNGLADFGGPPRAALGIVPCGTGNDFAKTIGVPREVDGAVATLFSGRRRRIDLGRARGPFWARGARFESEWFVNDFSAGFGALVVKDMAARPLHVRLLKGHAAYFVSGLLRAFAAAFPATIEIDGAVRSGRFHEVHVGNGRFCGGGIQYTPRAEVDDGRLDVTLLEEMSHLRFIAVNLRYVRHGTLAPDAAAGVVFERVRRFAIEEASGFPVYLDGEHREVDPRRGERARVEIEVAPGAIEAIAPPPP
jgi:diacylglycerol kinase (ATP)